MSELQALTINLPRELVDLVRAKVASGEYASDSDVVEDGLRALADTDDGDADDELQRFVSEQVIPAFDGLRADPSSALTADQVRASLAEHHAAAVRARA